MKTRLTASLALVATVAWAQEPKKTPTFIEEVKVNNVTVDVQVRDADGVPVTGLGIESFKILEDGVVQKTTNYLVVSGGQVSVAPDTALVGQAASRFVIVFFDLYQMVEPDKKTVLASVRDQIAGGLPPGNAMAIVSFDGSLRVHTPPTSSVEKLVGALKEVERLTATGLQRQIKLATYDVSTGPRRETMSSYQMRKTLNEEYWAEMQRIVGRVESAFGAALDRFSTLRGRKVVVFVSPGFPRASNVPMYRDYDFLLDTSPREYRNLGFYGKVAYLASELEYTLFTLDPSGTTLIESDASNASPPLFDDVASVRFWREADRKDSLIRAARLTGGEAIFTSDGGAALADVDRLTSSYYSLAFQPEHAGDGKEHTIKVEVAGHPDYRLNYRTKYVDRPNEQRQAERTRASLLTGEVANPLGIELVLDKPQGKFRFGANKMKRYRINAELRIPYAKLVMIPRGPVAWGQVQVVVLSTDTVGNQSELGFQKVPIEVAAGKLDEARRRGYFAYRFSFDIEGGEYSLHVAVGDTLGSTTSALKVDLKL